MNRVIIVLLVVILLVIVVSSKFSNSTCPICPTYSTLPINLVNANTNYKTNGNLGLNRDDLNYLWRAAGCTRDLPTNENATWYTNYTFGQQKQWWNTDSTVGSIPKLIGNMYNSFVNNPNNTDNTKLCYV